MTIFRNSIQSGTEYYCLWRKSHLMTSWEGLYKLRIRESEKLKTVLELYDLETHQKKIEPVYHRLKTMVKRSIEQDVRNWNFGIRNGNYEKKRRGQESGCSFRHDVANMTPSNLPPNSFMQQDERKTSRTRSPRGRSPSGRMSWWLCKDYLRGTCNNSFCKRWHPPECLYYKTKSGCRFGEKCSFAHRQVDEQPTKRSFNLHSIINNGLILGGQNSSKRQTVFYLPIDPRDNGHQDPEKIDFNELRRAQYLHSAWKKHQDAVFWVDINLAIQKGLTFYQTRSNAIILEVTLPAYCIPKVVRLKIEEVLYERPYMSLRPPPKISLRHDHDWTRGNDELGSTVE